MYIYNNIIYIYYNYNMYIYILGSSIVDLYVYLSHLPWPEDPSWAPWASPESATYRGQVQET